jgi:hypothetical protein
MKRDKHLWLEQADADGLDQLAEKEGLSGKGRYGDMARIIIRRAIRAMEAEGAQ